MSIARTSARHPWKVVAAWAVLLVVAMGLTSSLLSDALTTGWSFATNPESEQGRKLLEDRLRGPQRDREAVIIRNTATTVDDASYRAFVDDIATRIAALGPATVESSLTTYQAQAGGQGGLAATLISQDRHVTMIPVTLAGRFDEAGENVKPILDIVKQANGRDGFEVYVAGNGAMGHDFQTGAEEDLARGEMFGGLLALIILALVFGALVAAVIPVILAIFAIIAALGLTALAGQGFEFSFFVTNMITMMGLAVGIDYSLFIVSRFREERARGLSVIDAVDASMSTAGRAVLFSGITVIIALLGMLILPTSIYRSLALGASFVVGFAIIASLTLLPALMRLLGDKINAGRIRVPFLSSKEQDFDPDHSGGFWDKVARNVMAHPVIGVVTVTAVLLGAASFYLDVNAGQAGVSSLPDSFQSKQGFIILRDEFAGGSVTPAEVVIDGDANSPAVKSAIEKLQAATAQDKVFGPSAVQANPQGDLTLLSIQMAVDPSTPAADDAVNRLRDQYIPAAFDGVDAKVYVSGSTAFNLDFYELTDTYTPIVFVFVLGLSFILLMLVFRSIVVPAKAILMNLLSVGAAYGLIVLVSQKGFGADILGFQQVDTVEAWLPLFLFSVLFGLSMDYHVFLLSRIRERYLQRGDNTDAVAFGLRSTGRLITGAALIMVAVFGGFAMGELVMLQQVGFGLGVAVLLDATVVRSILVPASMKLLGKANWWLPSGLQWLPKIGIEEGPAPVQKAQRGSYASEPASGGS
jgi:RND superfamily putative drug exporter